MTSTVIEDTIGGVDHQFVIEQAESGYLLLYAQKLHFDGRWEWFPTTTFDSKADAEGFAKRFLAGAQQHADQIVDGNPDGIGDRLAITQTDEGYEVNGFTFQTREIAESYVEGYQESADRALGAVAESVRSGEDPVFDPAPIVDGNPDGIGGDAEILDLIGEPAIVDGNPGDNEPLHEALADVAAQVGYEAEVVEAAAEEVDDDDIAKAASKQAAAMDDAADALQEAAEVAAETAAEVFTETGVPTVEVAKTDTPEGEVISGEPAADDEPPVSQHWYHRKIGA